jgi:protein phosphatase
VVIVCRDEETARRRFGVLEAGIGICYTRTGRQFFNDSKIEDEFLRFVAGALTGANIWERFETDWVCLDAELMPWSAKAQELLRQQYAA